MTRTVTAGMVTEITGSRLAPIFLVKAEFDSGDVTLWNGVSSLTWAGDTYLGAGNLGAIGAVAENTDITAESVSVSLSGIPSAYLSIALSETFWDRPIRIWFGALNSSGALIADPLLVFRGRMDQMNVQEGASHATIEIKCESNLIMLTRPKERRYTAEDQHVDYPSDTGFNYVTAIQDAEVNWGNT